MKHKHAADTPYLFCPLPECTYKTTRGDVLYRHFNSDKHKLKKKGKQLKDENSKKTNKKMTSHKMDTLNAVGNALNVSRACKAVGNALQSSNSQCAEISSEIGRASCRERV
jgi:hypothetical protein